MYKESAQPMILREYVDKSQKTKSAAGVNFYHEK